MYYTRQAIFWVHLGRLDDRQHEASRPRFFGPFFGYIWEDWMTAIAGVYILMILGATL